MSASGERGVTLMEVLIAVTLLALLSAGMLTAMRVGLSAMSRTEGKLMDNRRVVGAQRILEQEIEGFMPAFADCRSEAPMPGAPIRIPFFQGEPEAMRFVSTFSLSGGWRGQPQVLELAVIPGEEGRGKRLIVNEFPYSADMAGRACVGQAMDPVFNMLLPRFRPIEPSPRSFVLADKLAGCRFSFLEPASGPMEAKDTWRPRWLLARWPIAIRVEMAPLEATATRLQPITITMPVRFFRSPEIQYVDR
jgi:prepilin-type N-terminal cleavage/methylation domain-containing protein